MKFSQQFKSWLEEILMILCDLEASCSENKWRKRLSEYSMENFNKFVGEIFQIEIFIKIKSTLK